MRECQPLKPKLLGQVHSQCEIDSWLWWDYEVGCQPLIFVIFIAKTSWERGLAKGHTPKTVAIPLVCRVQLSQSQHPNPNFFGRSTLKVSSLASVGWISTFNANFLGKSTLKVGSLTLVGLKRWAPVNLSCFCYFIAPNSWERGLGNQDTPNNSSNTSGTHSLAG